MWIIPWKELSLKVIANYNRKLHNLRIMVVESVHVLVSMLSNKYIVDLVYPICLEVSMINVEFGFCLYLPLIILVWVILPNSVVCQC